MPARTPSLLDRVNAAGDAGVSDGVGVLRRVGDVFFFRAGERRRVVLAASVTSRQLALKWRAFKDGAR